MKKTKEKQASTGIIYVPYEVQVQVEISMATFQAIGLNLAIGSAVFAASLVAFSTAVHWEWNAELAPRTWARPTEVLKNVLQGQGQAGSPSRKSGRFYGISWIPWTLGLSYQQMLEGIPGTGTRRNGWSGSMLRCNLEGIVAIKFHALCFKVAIFATVLCMTIILPINVTAECQPSISGAAICTNITRLTNFESTTLAHIPPMDFVDASSIATSSTTSNGDVHSPRFSSEFIVASLESYFWTSPGITSRLFVIVIVSWAICIYTCSKSRTMDPKTCQTLSPALPQFSYQYSHLSIDMERMD